MTDDLDLAQVRDEFEAALAATRSHESEFLGLHVSEARKFARNLGLDIEVVGPLEPVTADLRSRRMRVVVEKAIVVGSSGG